jgi:hypothetical protein
MASKISKAHCPSRQNINKKYMVVVIDNATMDGSRGNPPVVSTRIVTAGSLSEAEDRAVAEDNLQNDYGPDDDGGFIAVAAFDREDLERFLAKMAEPE